MTLCPRCNINYDIYCIRCGHGSRPEPPPSPPKLKIHKSYAAVGRKIVNDKWGRNNTDTIEEQLQANDDPFRMICLMAAMLQEMQVIRQSIDNAFNRLSRVIEKAPLKAEIALEKERQKTADKQRKANEALPTNVKVIQCPNEVIERIPQRRVRRHF